VRILRTRVGIDTSGEVGEREEGRRVDRAERKVEQGEQTSQE
jgi:hypothetical protein